HVRDPADPVAFWEKKLGPEFYIVHFNRQPGVAAAAFDRNPEQFLRNMYRAKQWLSADTRGKGLAGQSIIHLADTVVEAGESIMSDADLQVFVEAFKAGGFMAPSNWYRNFTRNWATTADVEQLVRQPALMIYGAHDMVKAADMTAYVPDLEIHTLPCGHWIQQELPVETNRLLLDWLERRMRPLF
ncbi:MAG: pimeloyl-ACP methyl ester carboxylesterase, partial [Saprospiraceae bacterium]